MFFGKTLVVAACVASNILTAASSRGREQIHEANSTSTSMSLASLGRVPFLSFPKLWLTLAVLVGHRARAIGKSAFHLHSRDSGLQVSSS